MVLLAFLRIATHASIMPAPLSIEQATDQMNDWLSAPGAIVLDPTSRHASVLTGLMRESRSPGNLVNDAHLAALAVEHGARIVSHDHDFHRFCGVRHQLPW
jgi:toxin-antitoxin system PIN domain toxin